MGASISIAERLREHHEPSVDMRRDFGSVTGEFRNRCVHPMRHIDLDFHSYPGPDVSNLEGRI